jgi:hypothetical protein
LRHHGQKRRVERAACFNSDDAGIRGILRCGLMAQRRRCFRSEAISNGKEGAQGTDAQRRDRHELNRHRVSPQIKLTVPELQRIACRGT